IIETEDIRWHHVHVKRSKVDIDSDNVKQSHEQLVHLRHMYTTN
ncbi:24765_t:CDS:2, partial [Gigaspora rosea]